MHFEKIINPNYALSQYQFSLSLMRYTVLRYLQKQPLLARLCNRLGPDFVTFTACKKSRFGLKRGKKAQCISNRCKDLFERKKYFGFRCTLIEIAVYRVSIIVCYT